MTAIVGGLLVLSFLTRPSISKSESTAYNLIYPNTEIVSLYKKKTSNSKSDIDIINQLIDNISDSRREITYQLKKKFKASANLKVKMDLLSMTKATLTDNQIKEYRKFVSLCKEEELKLLAVTETAKSNDNFEVIKDEICLNNACNTSTIIGEFKRLFSYQQEQIYLIKSITRLTENLLAII